MSCPLLGHLDPDYLAIMDEIQELLRKVFQTSHRLTLSLSGTGSAGMEAAADNFVEEGDSVLVGVHGFFGQRIAECIGRSGGECTIVRAPFGDPLDEKALARAAEQCKPTMIAVVHAETSTGVLQPLEPIREICERFEALLLVDAVTSLGGHPVSVDERGVDICYSCSQKCLGCPPGLSPFTTSPRALRKLENRKKVPNSWYLDLALIQKYWGQERIYHHTAPVSMNYALREGLLAVLEEGLEERWRRHRRNQRALVAGIEEMGLRMRVAPEHRLWTLSTVLIPDGIDEIALRGQLLSQFNLEIGGGLGDLKGKVWRIGLMGETSRSKNVLYCLDALEQSLRRQGFGCRQGAGVEAARAYLDSAKVATSSR